MSEEVIESGIGTVNYGKQTAKGAIATAATTTVGYDQPKIQEGTFKPGKTNAMKEFVDGQRFSSATEYTDKIGGDVGTLTVQAQPENIGLYYAQILGVDTVTGSGDPWTHTITSAGTSGAWATWWTKVGANIGPVRLLYSDSKLNKLVQKSSDKDKIVELALSVMSCNPAQVYVTDPAKTQATSDPYLFTQSNGKLTFDGKAMSMFNEEIVEVDAGLEDVYGNDIRPGALVPKKGHLLRTLKTIVTGNSLELFNKALFGEVAPAENTIPVKTVYYAAAESVYEQSATRKVTIKTPRIAVKADEMEIAPQAEGGPVDITFGGECKKEGSTPALTVTVLSGEEHSYA